MDMRDEVVLITGASRGLGRAFAHALAERGARVALTGRSADALQRTVDELGQPPDRVLAVPADVTDPDAVVGAIAAVEARLGSINVLINNAGQLRAVGSIGVVDPAEWWREVEVNLRGPFLYAHGVLPRMRARAAGRIINVASGAGLVALPQVSAYNVSKTALIRLSETLALEAAGSGVRVFAIHPGTVWTPMNAHLHDSAEVAATAPEVQHWFRTLFAEGRDTPIERSVELVVRLARGDADALSGWYVSVDDDLDALVREHVAEPRLGRRTLRMQM